MAVSNKKNERIGVIFTNKLGEKAECINYVDCSHITIKLLDYDIEYNTNWKRFKRGEFSSRHHKEKIRVGQSRTNMRGDTATCIEYFKTDNITLQFEDGTIIKNCNWQCFDKCEFISPSQLPQNRIGQIYENKLGLKAQCIEYKNAWDITIKFIDYDYTMNIAWSDFIRGNFIGDSYKLTREGQERVNADGITGICVRYDEADHVYIKHKDTDEIIHTQWDHFDKGCFEFILDKVNRYGGIHGGKYPAYVNFEATKEYNMWIQMLRRCFDEKYKQVQPTYVNAICSEEFMNYTYFYEFLHKQENFEVFINDDSVRWQLDKDIIGGKSNKLYSAHTTCLVPQNVNALFTKGDVYRKERGKDTPIGVRHRYGNKYAAVCCDPKYKKNIHLGTFETPEDAFNAYKSYKEAIIKQVAIDEYTLGRISKKCYEAMMDYQVEITD